MAAFKQACKKRHGNTTQWLVQSSDFQRWADETEFSVLWCSGKRMSRLHSTQPQLTIYLVGSGKTVLTFVPSLTENQALTDGRESEQELLRNCTVIEITRRTCESHSSFANSTKLHP